jgi:electron transport complex protein RnfA
MLLATAATWPLYHMLLLPYGLEYLNIIVFVLVIVALLQLVEIIVKKKMPAVNRSFGVYLPLIATNCAVLGVALLNIEEGLTFAHSMVNAAGAGIGFLVAMVMFTSVRIRLESGEVSKSFEGIPIMLIAASLLALGFMGFTGIAEGILG